MRHRRGTPKELSIRIKRYYHFFYQKQVLTLPHLHQLLMCLGLCLTTAR